MLRQHVKVEEKLRKIFFYFKFLEIILLARQLLHTIDLHLWVSS
jgi:hypothetical protein